MPTLRKRPLYEVTTFHGIATASTNMLDFFRLVEKAARSEANILIRGESGSGKELGEGETIKLKDLTPELQGIPIPLETGLVPESIVHHEIESIRLALRDSKNRKGVAAEKLGISRATLWRKIRELGIS